MLRLSWTGARNCNPSGTDAQLGYIVRYGSFNTIGEPDMQMVTVNDASLELLASDLAIDVMYYFQVASVISQTNGQVMSPFSHCINVIGNTLPERQCQTMMYECIIQSTLTTISMGTETQTSQTSSTTDTFTQLGIAIIIRESTSTFLFSKAQF